MRRAALAAAFSIIAASLAQAEGEPPGDFDFYVLALSWSPSWCAASPERRAERQCREGFRFVVHGLWPQYERGYPEFCTPDSEPSREEVDAMFDIMPDRDLIRHEWRKHGSCSGLSAEGYFAATRAAFEQVDIPPRFEGLTDEDELSAAEIESAFAEANPGLTETGMAIDCDDEVMAEVRICLTRNLAFRTCEEVDRLGCRAESLALPAPN